MIEIRLQEGLDSESWSYLTGWSEFVFPVEGKSMEWAPLRWHALAIDAGRPVAHVGFDRFLIDVDDSRVDVVGVGGVVVRPEYQGQRIPAALFQRLHVECPPPCAASAFTLFCPERLVTYYGKQGYARFAGTVKIVQAGELTSTRFAFMTRGNGIPPTARRVRLLGLPW